MPSLSGNGKVFLRIVQSLSPGVRSSIAVPAEEKGIEQLKQALDEAVEKFWTEGESSNERFDELSNNFQTSRRTRWCRRDARSAWEARCSSSTRDPTDAASSSV